MVHGTGRPSFGKPGRLEKRTNRYNENDNVNSLVLSVSTSVLCSGAAGKSGRIADWAGAAAAAGVLVTPSARHSGGRGGGDSDTR